MRGEHRVDRDGRELARHVPRALRPRARASANDAAHGGGERRGALAAVSRSRRMWWRSSAMLASSEK
jgi:hypothetical protein